MRIKVFKVFGREVLRIENHYEATVSDVVQAMIANRDEDVEYVYECTCGEEEDEEESDDDGITGRFADMTERIVWDARTEDYPLPKSLFDKPKKDDEDN